MKKRPRFPYPSVHFAPGGPRPLRDEWLAKGLTYPLANIWFFQQLGIVSIEPTDEAVDAVCDLMEDPDAFQEALFKVMDSREDMAWVEELLWIRPGDLTNAGDELKFIVLKPFIEGAEKVLRITSYDYD